MGGGDVVWSWVFDCRYDGRLIIAKVSHVRVGHYALYSAPGKHFSLPPAACTLLVPISLLPISLPPVACILSFLHLSLLYLTCIYLCLSLLYPSLLVLSLSCIYLWQDRGGGSLTMLATVKQQVVSSQ